MAFIATASPVSETRIAYTVHPCERYVKAGFVQVGQFNVDLAKDDPVKGSSADHTVVALQLIPVGCKFYNMTLQRLLRLIKCILATLIAIHEAGFVHRDVHESNMIETGSGFCLIDSELAGKIDEFVFWRSARLPQDVDLKVRPFVYADDLWQLGNCILRLAVLTPPLRAFVERLLCGRSGTAQAAFEALQEL